MIKSHKQQKLVALICTHNRSELLTQAIDSINDAIAPSNCDIEILVIANACTDGTIERLNQYKADTGLIPLKYVIEPRAGKSFALNHAIDLIPDSFICFIDDDQKLDQSYFIKTIDAINKYPEASIICGRLLPDWNGREPSWIHNNSEYKIYPFPIPTFDLGEMPLTINIGMELPPGGQVIIHSSVFKKFGKFSEHLGPIGHNLMGSEDTDFFQRVLSKGGTIQYVPQIIQYHFVDNERLKLSYLLKKSFQRNRSFTITRPHLYPSMPFYLGKILIKNVFNLVLSTNLIRFRFYLMRTFSTLGELAGIFNIYYFRLFKK